MATRLNFRTVVVVPCERNTFYTARIFNLLFLKTAKRASMHEVVQRPSEQGSLEIDLFSLNGFESSYKFTRENNDWQMLRREWHEILFTAYWSIIMTSQVELSTEKFPAK